MLRMDEVALATRDEPLRTEEGGLPFAEFFERHHVRLYRAMWLVTRNRHEAEELMQDAFVRLWERWDRVRSLPDPEGYLYRTALNWPRDSTARGA